MSKKFLLSAPNDDLKTPPNNQIYYRTTTGEKQDPYNIYHADGTTPIFVGTDGTTQANLISNEYKDGYGVMTFDKELGGINQDVENFISCSAMVTGTNIPDDIVSVFSEVNLPATIIEYDYTFAYCKNLGRCKIPDGVTYLRGTFVNCLSLTEIEFPNSVTFFNFVLAGSGVKTVIVPEKVESIGDESFANCKELTNVTIGNNVKTIGNMAFSYCVKLKTIDIPNSVTSIGDSAFYNCTSLTSITIPNSVTEIGWSAFSGCTGLTSVTIPNSVTSIGYSAFAGCTSLTTLTIEATTPPTFGTEVFTNCTSLTKIQVPSSSIDLYKAADGWKEHADKIVPITD